MMSQFKSKYSTQFLNRSIEYMTVHNKTDPNQSIQRYPLSSIMYQSMRRQNAQNKIVKFNATCFNTIHFIYQNSSMQHVLLVFITLITLPLVHTAPNGIYSPGSTQCDSYTYCPAHCTYLFSAGTLAAGCSSGLTGTLTFNSAVCTACDPLLFHPVSIGNRCVPHLLNNEQVQEYKSFISTGVRLGRYSSTIAGVGQSYISSGSPINPSYIFTFVSIGTDHYAARIRFSVYLYRNELTDYYYPLNYSMDNTTYTYDQSTLNYFSCTDIVTSPLQAHFTQNLTVIWNNTNTTSLPYNIHGCSNCNCGCFLAGGSTCCENKYIQILDVLLMVSKCPTYCATCYSPTNCSTCTGSNKLNYADRLCYPSCPQATYYNNSMYQIGGYTGGSIYTTSTQSYCVTCYKYCMQCISSTVCTRCYTIGRNQSYLFNGTCINPCINGYFANMTNHTCDCPSIYYFEIINAANFTMLCYPCAFECKKCFERTNLNCTQCQKGFYLVNGTTHCLNQCPAGQFIYSATDTCFFCDISCSACINTSTTCTACFTNTLRYLFENKCFLSCPWGYAWNNISRTCDLCKLYTYSYQGKCVQICPNNYETNLQNRSCLHLSETSFRYSLVLESIHVLQHGKLFQYTVLLQDGLDEISENWMKRYSYQMVQIVYGNSRLDDFVGIRSLQNLTLTIRNLNYANNRITYSTNIPPNMDYHKSFQVVFLHTLYSQQGIKYNNQTNVFSINQHPQLLKEYYTYAARNYNDMILIPFLSIFFFLFALYLRGTYEMFIEVFRVVQLLGVLLYSAFPIGSYTFYFLVGCSYTNFDFVPNLYAMFAKTDSSSVFASYFLNSPDMDFIRLMGSVLFFGVISLVVYMICRFVLNFKEHRLDYMSKLCIDLMEVKILHSFWSSLLYVVSNYQKNEFGMYMIFIFAIIFLGAIIGRRYSIWKETQDFSPFFVWRFISTLLLCFVAMANEIVISVLVIASLIVTLWNFFMLHSDKYLVGIDDLNSSNYMEERTYRVLNNYDIQVSYSFSITFRNIIITVCPFMTSILAGILILLRDEQTFSIILSSVLIYSLVLLLVINSIFIYLFLKERRKFLVNNKLEYLRKKYSKIGTNDTQVFDQRKRPRAHKSINFDEQKYLQSGGVNRNMIKSVDS